MINKQKKKHQTLENPVISRTQLIFMLFFRQNNLFKKNYDNFIQNRNVYPQKYQHKMFATTAPLSFNSILLSIKCDIGCYKFTIIFNLDKKKNENEKRFCSRVYLTVASIVQ